MSEETRFENAVVTRIPVAKKNVWLNVMTMYKEGTEPKKYVKINECWQTDDGEWRNSPKIIKNSKYGDRPTMNVNFPVNTPEEITNFEEMVNGLNQLLDDFKKNVDPFT